MGPLGGVRGESVQDHGAFGYTFGEYTGDEVAQAEGVDRLPGCAQFLQRPPAVGPDVVGLGGPGGVDIPGRKVREKVQLDLADFPPADGVVLAALRKLPAQRDVLYVDAEFFVQLAECGGGVVLPCLQGAAGGGPEAAALVVVQEQDPVVVVKER